MAEEKKTTFKELLERHGINFSDFYENCLEVPVEDITTLYLENICVRSRGEKMIAWVNKYANMSYTIEDIHVERIY